MTVADKWEYRVVPLNTLVKPPPIEVCGSDGWRAVPGICFPLGDEWCVLMERKN